MQKPPLRNGWDYEDHPDHEAKLPHRCEQVLKRLYRDSKNKSQNGRRIKDTRGDHLALFIGLTPPYYPFFAGEYRGSLHYKGLKRYEVRIRGDSRVGTVSNQVLHQINNLGNYADQAFAALDNVWGDTTKGLEPAQKLMYTVRVACEFFVELLRIHPYANGNGHIARFCIFGFLARYSIYPKRWPLNDRPPDPPYSRLIAEYRDGSREGLERFVLLCVLGTI